MEKKKLDPYHPDVNKTVESINIYNTLRKFL